MKTKMSLVTCVSVLALCTQAHAQTTPTAMAATQSEPAGSATTSSETGNTAPATLADRPTQDIVVTAAKSGAQTLQKTPLAIQAFTGAELKARNIQNVGGLINSVPGASIGQESAAGIVSYNIRGVGAGGTNGDTPIGYYLDEVPFNIPNFGIAPPIRFIDIAQVDVLRGPQGTLYGQGSAGGTIIFHTRDPNLEKVETAAEVYGSSTRGASGLNWGASAAVSVPIVKDVLAIRLSGGYSKQHGYADAYFGAINGAPNEKDVNTQKNSDWRVAALFKPTEKLTIRGQVWQFRPRQRFESLYSSVSPYAYAQTGGIDGFSPAKFTLYSLVGDLDLRGVAVTSATSYLKGSFGARTPLGPFGIPGGKFDSNFYPEVFNQELRAHSTGAGPFHWLIGGTFTDGQGPQRNIIDYVVFTQDTSNNAKTKSYAGFGEVSYDLFGGKLVPLVGLRYFHDKRTYVDATSRLPETLKKTTYRLNLSYLPDRNLTIFATVSTGFRENTVQSALQAQVLQADGLPADILLSPLSLTNYEIGVKARLLGGALNLGVNPYHIRYHGLQSGYTSSVGIGGFVNVGNAHSTGIDFNIDWRTPLPGLSVDAVANVNSSKYDAVVPQVSAQFPGIVRGGRLIEAAKYNFRVDVNYNVAIGRDVRLVSNVNYNRTGNRATIAGVTAGAYDLAGATVGLQRGAYELALFGDNLTDQRGPTDYFLPNLFSGPIPRTIGVRMRKSF